MSENVMHELPSHPRAWPLSVFACLLLVPATALGQEPPEDPKAPAEGTPEPEAKPAATKTPWYEKLTLRGYAQLRFNRLYASDDDFANPLGDPATADDNRFSLRRARLVVSGDVAPYLSVYLQAEFAGSDAKMRDWYGDIYLDGDKQLRLRVGQSKIPYGFENLQSSSQRAPLDRADALNSGHPGERDLGVIAYWEPVAARTLYKHLTDSGLKGSGDYGVLALGVYNGQGINVLDANDNLHVVARANYPFRVGGQILEAGVSGFVGKFTVTTSPMITGGDSVRDMRAAASFVLYPQPIGVQAEYTIGKGPELEGTTIDSEFLHGGYAMVIARFGDFVPFVRGSYYDGAYKGFTDAPSAEVKELVVGSEWHVKKGIKLTGELDRARRTIENVTVDGTLIRAQLQFSY